ncbi:MAG: exodeoxyribonuclease VII small subunit [Actinomycetota bacterium]|nr:exodeoxyribonuclease VII small subunit [Actinomycetota bacterium]
MTSKADTNATPVATLGYAQAKDELDNIVEELEDGRVDIDELVARMQRASEIVEELERRILATKKQVDELLPKLQRTQPSNTDGGYVQPPTRASESTGEDADEAWFASGAGEEVEYSRGRSNLGIADTSLAEDQEPESLFDDEAELR